MQADRTLSAFGTQTFFRGAIIGCYTCHNGPSSESGNSSAPPAVTSISTTTSNDKSVAMTLPVTGAGAALRIISQPANGSVGLTNGVATYFPYSGFVGTDTFTFAAYDGAKNSGLATGTVTVTQGPVSVGVQASVPPSYPAVWPAAFAVVPAVTNSTSPATFDWDFGDGTPHSSSQYATHAYATPGTYQWSVTAAVSGVPASASGSITITDPVVLNTSPAGSLLTLSWPTTLCDTLLEFSTSVGPGATWTWITNVPPNAPAMVMVNPAASGSSFYRVRRPW
jgi:PKD repeat protein